MTETRIYVGLNDAVTLKQEHETEKYIETLQYVCYNYHVAFSFALQQGGYFHENGQFTQEQTLVLSLIDTPEETVNEIARDLCVFFRQESVMVTESDVRTYFIEGKKVLEEG